MHIYTLTSCQIACILRNISKGLFNYEIDLKRENSRHETTSNRPKIKWVPVTHFWECASFFLLVLKKNGY